MFSRRTRSILLSSASCRSTAAAPEFYLRLGVAAEASTEDIKVAYRRRALQVHPDLVPVEEKESADVEFRKISEAYQCLMNPSERRKYDAKNRVVNTPTKDVSTSAQTPPPPPKDENGRTDYSHVEMFSDQDRWHRYNRFRSGKRVYYTADKANRINISRRRSDDMFRNAFHGRRPEHIVLDLHQAIKRQTEKGATTPNYGIDANEYKEYVARNVESIRAQARKPPPGIRAPKKPPSSHIPFVPPSNWVVPRGVTFETIPETTWIPKLDVENQQIEEAHSEMKVRDWSKRWHMAYLKHTFGGADSREYVANVTKAQRENVWRHNTGMLYSWHRPF
eukprot:PhM_4_TR10402/c0_g1_i1/m.33716